MKNRVADHRARIRQRGYKEVRYWVPDVTSPEFARRIHDEANALNAVDAREHTGEILEDLQAEALAEP